MSTQEHPVTLPVPQSFAPQDSKRTPFVTAPTMAVVPQNLRSLQSGNDFPKRLELGDILNGRYLILKFLASGGFSDVYGAFDQVKKCDVALKILKSCVSQEQRRNVEERFFQDARLSADMAHPNIVRVMDIEDTTLLEPRDGGCLCFQIPFFTMELLSGTTLKQFLRTQGPLEPRRAAHLMLGFLRGLSEGHSRGIVHKDLKPSNLFFVHAGQPEEHFKILDFGTARLLEPGAALTWNGNQCLTPRYAAPEYMIDCTVSPAVDVYQAGLIFVEALTGTPLVEASNLGMCFQIHNAGLALPEALNDSCFAPMLRRALARQPTDRYPNAKAFADALTRRCRTVFR